MPRGHGGGWPWWGRRHPWVAVLSPSPSPELGSAGRHIEGVVMELPPLPQVKTLPSWRREIWG